MRPIRTLLARLRAWRWARWQHRQRIELNPRVARGRQARRALLIYEAEQTARRGD